MCDQRGNQEVNSYFDVSCGQRLLTTEAPLDVITTASFAECEESCDGPGETCNAFSFDCSSALNNCKLYGLGFAPDYAPDALSTAGIRDDVSLPRKPQCPDARTDPICQPRGATDLFRGHFNTYCGQTLDVPDSRAYNITRAANAAQCGNLCSGSAQCAAFTFDCSIGTRNCIFASRSFSFESRHTGERCRQAVQAPSGQCRRASGLPGGCGERHDGRRGDGGRDDPPADAEA